MGLGVDRCASRPGVGNCPDRLVDITINEAWGYMEEDRGFPHYFACLSLFTFSMLGIVLANNLVELFIFWELVGVSRLWRWRCSPTA